MYQIVRITDREGNEKTDGASRKHLGCIGEAKMEDGCALIHCRYDRQGEPCDRYIRTSLVRSWKKDKISGRIMLETCNSVYYLDSIKSSG